MTRTVAGWIPWNPALKAKKPIPGGMGSHRMGGLKASARRISPQASLLMNVNPA